MTRFRIVTLLACVTVVSIAVGFGLGVRKGAKLGETVEDPPRGVLAVRALTDLNNEATKSAKLVLEMQVNRGLYSAHELLDSPIRPFIRLLLGPDTGVDHVEDYATKLAKYRKATPSPFQGEYFTHDPSETPERRALIDEATQRHRENARIIQLMIERYASK